MDTRYRFRKIHLDFHNSPLIDDLGADFTADQFAGRLAHAHVNYVVCFAKCHHGMCYYNTRKGRKHPALKFDLLGEQIEACHRRDIAVSGYLSVVWEEDAARLHPEWQQLGPDGMPRHKIPGDRWATVCLNSPYIDKILIPQTMEVVEGYDVDGMWFDMVHLDDNACYCRWCRARMKKMGLSYDDPRDCFAHTAASVYEFLDKCSDAIWSAKPGIDIEYNSQVRFNPRGALSYITGFEIECTPSERGYLYFGMFARHARNYGLPTRGVTPRFHRIWGDWGSVKNIAQLRWETATMLANGSACSVGDQMHPRCFLDELTYQRIGDVFAEVEAREPWCRDAQPQAEIAVLVDDDITDFGIAKAPDAVWGVTRMLVESHCQFNIIDTQADISSYSLLILPDNRMIDAGVATKIRDYVQKGGKVIASGAALFDAEQRDILSLNIVCRGKTETSVNYVRPRQGDTELPLSDYVVRYPFTKIDCPLGMDIIAETILPYFERSPEHFTSHLHAPPHKQSSHSAIVHKGNCVYIAAPLFEGYHRDSDTHCRSLFHRCLDLLLPERMVHSGPYPMIEITVLRQDKRAIVHLVNYAANKRGSAPETIEMIPPVYRVPLKLRYDASPRKVMAIPSGEVIDFAIKGKYVEITVPVIDIHQMIVFEE